MSFAKKSMFRLNEGTKSLRKKDAARDYEE